MSEFLLEFNDYSLLIKRKLDLKRVYLEITNQCNLNCKMCFRKFWKDSIGKMSLAQFQEILSQIKEFPSIDTIYFGGIGEPTLHPEFLNFVKLVKESGYRLEFGTNGTHLSQYSDDLIKYGVDRITVSIDAPEPDIFHSLRGTSLSSIEDNILRIQARKKELKSYIPELSLEVVIIKDNIDLLFNIMRLAHKLDITHILFSNLMPFSSLMAKEIAYDGSLDYKKLINDLNRHIGKYNVKLEFPKFDLQTERICQFIENKSTVIRWDGEVCPCYRFLHNYAEYIFGRKKSVIAYSFGNIFKEKLSDIWTSRPYEVFKYIVKNALYPSCTDCLLREVCHFVEDTEFDCWGDNPSCGDCLWARGLIRCP